jgi:hypothetical protein
MLLKTPNKIALVAAPVGLVAALLSVTGAFAQSPTHHPSTSTPASVAAPANAPTTAPSQSPDAETSDASAAGAAAESAAETNAEATTPETDAAGGHADNPNDPNADHQFNGEE